MSRTRTQVYKMFLAGKAHPHCPVCGHTKLTVRGMITRKFQLWRGYVCRRCSERYIATVDPHGVDMRV